jgi:hypothetical protein
MFFKRNFAFHGLRPFYDLCARGNERSSTRIVGLHAVHVLQRPTEPREIAISRPIWEFNTVSRLINRRIQGNADENGPVIAAAYDRAA